MNKYLIVKLFFLLFCNYLFSQDSIIVYEQRALDFLYDSILVKKPTVIFNGFSSTYKTFLTNTCVDKKHQKDSTIKRLIRIETELIHNGHLLDLVRPMSFLHIKDSIKLYYKGKVNNRKHSIKNRFILNICHHIKIYNSVFINIELRSRKKYLEYIFKLDEKGNIIDFCIEEINYNNKKIRWNKKD